jgi:hypothetical protein
VSVTEPIDVVNAGMVKQTKGHRLALSRISSPSVALWLVGFTGFLTWLKSFIVLNMLGLLAERVIALCWS